MLSIKKSHPFTYYISLFILTIYCLVFYMYFPANILAWDTFGYYLYLPSYFIHHDLALHDQAKIQHIIETYNNTATFYQAFPLATGDWVIKYTAGSAIMYSPFFFIGHCCAKLTGYAPDGFSYPYQVAITWGSFLYTVIGMWYVLKFTTSLFKDAVCVWIMICVFLATNYLIHSDAHGQGAMTHNYLFTLYALLLWWSKKANKQKKSIQVVVCGLLCGLICLVRPTEIIAVLIPLLYGIRSVKSLMEKIRTFGGLKIGLFACSFLLVVSIQFMYWKTITGSWLFYSYANNPGEGFEFFHPFIKEVLFSFRKGWLLYTPIMAFALFGFIGLFKNNRALFYMVFVFFILDFYIVSSWSCWWYAASFGQRALIPAYPLLAIPLGYFINWVFEKKLVVRLSCSIIILLMVGLNLFQSWQMTAGILSPSDMSKTYYFRTFGKTTVTDEDRKYLLVPRSITGYETFLDTLSKDHFKAKEISIGFEQLNPAYPANYNKVNKVAGQYSLMLASPVEYTPAIDIPYDSLTLKYYAWVKISAWVFPTKPAEQLQASLVATFIHKKYRYKYVDKELNTFKLIPGRWNYISFYYQTPEIRNTQDRFGAFLWNRKDTLLVDDLKIEVLEPKIEP